MHSSAILLALQCTLCLSIRVPVVWNDNSEVSENTQFAVETIQPQNVNEQKPQTQSQNVNTPKPIPIEYFQYTAQKPKFAVDIAKFHGVQSPENHYKAYPVKPHTGVAKPELGKHQMLDKEKAIFRPYQEYLKKNEATRYVTPSTTSYEVFHPYKLEEPALQELYKDPIMDKIRNDLRNTKNRLQKYENEAGEPDISKGEYLETPEETDRKKIPHRNVPAPYEIHHPQRRPIYYRPPIIHNYREHALNQKFRHPWHQNYVKVKPMHYRPIKTHLQRLRQQHALKYDDEHNEYPQVPPPEKYSEPSDGYDIYEKGKAKFVQLRNNVDESINEAVKKNRPVVNQNLELNNDNSEEDTNTEDEEDEFVPIKNYAQVRRTETTKHLPKEAAFHDADTLDEIRNAPRLREAIKSTKAQTVYSEEGYEDSAYDHAGEQKHASDHEGHGGFLKENELSGGKYKTPTFSAKYNDGDSSEYRDQILDGKKWKDNKKDTEEETDSEDYSENEQEDSVETNIYDHEPKKNTSDEIQSEDSNNRLQNDENDRLKREERPEKEISEKKAEHDVNKREAKIDVPQINLNSTYLTEKEILKLFKQKALPITNRQAISVSEKYPYYFKKLKSISKDSPLRYAENLQLIPKKSEGGTEFYDSRSKFECPEVEDEVDPVPEKLKKGGHPDENDDDDDEETDEDKKDKTDFSGLDEKSRLNGLGDKIDCFKAKYFGENPLDSPFFKEDIISNPEPVIIPSIDIYKLKQAKEQLAKEYKTNKSTNLPNEPKDKAKMNALQIKNQFYREPHIELSNNKPILQKISPLSNSSKIRSTPHFSPHVSQGKLRNAGNVAYINIEQKEAETKMPVNVRVRRATPFIYEPYKIIRDSQVQDSKKTTTTNNISPLIKQLQSSRVVDRVATNQGKEQIVKRNARSRTYKDIGKSDREKNIGKEKGSKPLEDASFVDVRVDQRRGEPRYELRIGNHKSQYTPVENKTSMTVEDYKSKTNSEKNIDDYDLTERKETTIRPFFDVSKFLPQTKDSEETKHINDEPKEQPVKEYQSRSDKSSESKGIEDDYAEYDDDDDNDNDHTSTTSTTTTTTTKSPQRRRRITTTSTTARPQTDNDEAEIDVPKLRLITRFRDSYQTENPRVPKRIRNPTTKVYDDEEISVPKYREKKKKSSKSTLVTDTKSYGEDDDDDLRKEEVDALIGVKQDINDYMPLYEKAQKKVSSTENVPKSQRDDKDDDDFEEDDHEHRREDDEDEDEEENEDENNDDDDDEDEEDVEDEESKSEEEPLEELTTPEPTKKTLSRTTEAPLSTTEAQFAKLEIKPVVLKKKIEIHKELPVNRSSPHITEFKQDIKEVEIVKEIPTKTKKKPQKNIEALELYKDENLAIDVNKLGGVEVFKEELDLVNGPKHGGNYRSAEDINHETSRSTKSKGDVIASQSKTSKLIEATENPYSRRRASIQRARNNRGRNAKFIELSDSTERGTSRPMHGGNFKSNRNERHRGDGWNEKLIELDDHDDSREEHSTNTHGGDFKSYGSRGTDRNRMHGGNYRSAKIIQAVTTTTEESNTSDNLSKKRNNKDGRRNAAMILSSIASAVPDLTTTPAYILDPSKRMYYYVDA